MLGASTAGVLEAFDDLDAPDALELLAKAPAPGQASRLTIAAISAALTATGSSSTLLTPDKVISAPATPRISEPK
ncbi:hypothetical protein OG203_10975 [Nocardia sp. NBC_01499]|uniref:hypothetical protein n=1 Tax=Nocardia sp. NBC_01499 TaxID=2903597 RepID=UPI0038704F4C